MKNLMTRGISVIVMLHPPRISRMVIPGPTNRGQYKLLRPRTMVRNALITHILQSLHVANVQLQVISQCHSKFSAASEELICCCDITHEPVSHLLTCFIGLLLFTVKSTPSVELVVIATLQGSCDTLNVKCSKNLRENSVAQHHRQTSGVSGFPFRTQQIVNLLWCK